MNLDENIFELGMTTFYEAIKYLLLHFIFSLSIFRSVGFRNMGILTTARIMRERYHNLPHLPPDKALPKARLDLADQMAPASGLLFC